MKFVDEFRDSESVLEAARLLRQEVQPDRSYHFMEFCGGHTHVIFRYGLHDLLPKNIRLIHGPGCPVCVLPRGRIDSAIELTRANPDVILCTYADLMRVPGSKDLSLLKAKANGADIRMVYSPDDALRLAVENPARRVVFLAIGFETTAPATASVLLEAQAKGVQNFFIYCLHLLTPPAIQHVLESPEVREMGTIKLDGFIGPGHVSTVIGTRPYDHFSEEYHKPVVVAGFAPLDILQALVFLVKMVNAGQAGVENQYRRVVSMEGNLKAQEIVSRAFELRREFEWRGLGNVPYSAFKLRAEFAPFDAEQVFSVTDVKAKDHPACLCGAIIRGIKTPLDCKLFKKACTPENPLGPCMVSSEGTCSAYYTVRQS